MAPIPPLPKQSVKSGIDWLTRGHGLHAIVEEWVPWAWEKRIDKIQLVQASIEKLSKEIEERKMPENKEMMTNEEIGEELRTAMNVFVHDCGYDFGNLAIKLDDVKDQLEHECRDGSIPPDGKEEEGFTRLTLA